MSAVEAKSKTDEIKKKAQKTIEKYVANGINRTQAGGKVLSIRDMQMAAKELADYIVRRATSCNLPESVMKDIESMSSTIPFKISSDMYEIDMFFTADLYRPSISEDYNGVVNIIALFNNGYLASNYAYGFWDGHKYTGNWNTLRTGFYSDFAYIRSKIYRPALQFMQDAVADFNSKYKNKYNVTVVLDSIYEEIPTVAK